MRILYAAGPREISYYQLLTYSRALRAAGHEVSVSGYLASLRSLPADYCLDALRDFLHPGDAKPMGSNYTYYAAQVRRWKPDVIISDLCRITSLIALEANLPLWQVSSSLLFYGLTTSWKRRLKIHDYTRTSLPYVGKITDMNLILTQSQRRCVVSHFADVTAPPLLSAEYEWVRPEFVLDNQNAITNGYPHELANNFYSQRYSVISYKEANIDITPAVNATIYYRLGQFETHPFRPETIDISLNPDSHFLSELFTT